jgi:hypothetical protein
MEQNRYERELGEAMNWEFVEDQYKGLGLDYIAKDGTRIEAKFDWDSIITGNHYLEIAQSSNGGKNWIPSGFSISADDADLWVVINDEWLRILSIEAVMRLITEHRASLKKAQTRIGVNFNKPEQFSKAYLIPFTLLDEYVMQKMPSPVRRD